MLGQAESPSLYRILQYCNMRKKNTQYAGFIDRELGKIGVKCPEESDSILLKFGITSSNLVF